MIRIAVVTPTRNERENVFALIRGMPASISHIVFADDSDDDTPRQAFRAGGWMERDVDVAHRPPGTRQGGLGGAVITGAKITPYGTDWIVVMDADGQHPSDMAPVLAQYGELGGYDVVIGTRYTDGGSPGEGLASPYRRIVSVVCNHLAQRLFPSELALVTDPMSGFFAVRRNLLAEASFKPEGYKILLELLLSQRLEVGEVGYTFLPREGGKSKAALPEGFRFLRRILQLRFRGVQKADIPEGKRVQDRS